MDTFDIVIALDLSTVSTGFASVLMENATKEKKVPIYVDTISFAKDEKALKDWARANAMIQKVLYAVDAQIKRNNGSPQRTVVLYEQMNVFLNANTVRAIARVTMPILWNLEVKMDIRTLPIQVMRARKHLLQRPPYKKENVMNILSKIANNNDEADAIAILLAYESFAGINYKKLKRTDAILS